MSVKSPTFAFAVRQKTEVVRALDPAQDLAGHTLDRHQGAVQNHVAAAASDAHPPTIAPSDQSHDRIHVREASHQLHNSRSVAVTVHLQPPEDQEVKVDHALKCDLIMLC